MFCDNELGEQLRTIHDNLNSLNWTKVDCICGIDCHNQIIGNYPLWMSKGIDVTVHISNNILHQYKEAVSNSTVTSTILGKK